MVCSEKLQLALDDLNSTIVDEKVNSSALFQDKFFNVTYDISYSSADAVGECYLTGYGFYQWGVNTFA